MPIKDSVSRERLAQSAATLKRLREETLDWIHGRQKRDKHRQYVTQLGTLKQQFELIFGELERAMGAIVDRNTRRQFYADCREIDRSVMWARRIYEWYRSKFDQRDDPDLAMTLEAADEIVWSCYA